MPNDAQISVNFEQILKANNAIKSGEFEKFSFDEKAQENYLNETILNFAKSHPNTQFLLVLPPYSTLYEAIKFQSQQEKFQFEKKMVKFMLSQNLPNVKIYAFGDLDFTDNLANYKDLTHYSEKINSEILKLILQNKGLLTPENFENYYEKISQKARNFDINFYAKEIKNLEQK